MDKKDIIIGKLNSNVKFGKRDGWLWSSLFWNYEDFLILKIFNKKIARSRRLSTSGRGIAFFVKKIEKRIHPWYNFCMKYRREVINNKISKEIIKNSIQNQKEV